MSHHEGGPPTGLSRRRLLRAGVAAGTTGLAAPLIAATGSVAAARERRPRSDGSAGSGEVIFREEFAGTTLNPTYWNPYITDNNAEGWPWSMQEDVAKPSSAVSWGDGDNAEYDLPSAVEVDDGLTLQAHRGTTATGGYTWTSSVICSYATHNDFGDGPIDTPGFAFVDARVDVVARMPDSRLGGWGCIWFMQSPDGQGNQEIDLIETGFLHDGLDPNRVVNSTFHPDGGQPSQSRHLDTGVDLSAGFHRYTLEYRQGVSFETYVDGNPVASFTTNVPTGPYYIILSNQVGSAKTADWHTTDDGTAPSPNPMDVSLIEVTRL